jgi:hypothetical protein
LLAFAEWGGFNSLTVHDDPLPVHGCTGRIQNVKSVLLSRYGLGDNFTAWFSAVCDQHGRDYTESTGDQEWYEPDGQALVGSGVFEHTCHDRPGYPADSVCGKH